MDDSDETAGLRHRLYGPEDEWFHEEDEELNWLDPAYLDLLVRAVDDPECQRRDYALVLLYLIVGDHVLGMDLADDIEIRDFVRDLGEGHHAWVNSW